MTKTKSDNIFVDGTALHERIRYRPDVIEGREERREAEDEMERVYAENLAAVRKASEMTQREIAKKLGVGQAAVSKLESRHDLLLSTLMGYLEANGASNPTISITINGQRIELNLQSL